MCKCKDPEKKSCGCWKKWLLIGFLAVAALGVGYWYWSQKQSAE